jgi:flagellar motor switch protein FliG
VEPPAAVASAPEAGARPPFEFLHEATPDSLAALLAGEHPQTAALVLAHLAPVHAARVMQTLPAALQAEVVRRMIDLEETAPEILREVERQIEALLSHELRANRRRDAGLATVGAILAAAGSAGREAILSSVSGVDQGLARRLDDEVEQTAVVSAASRWRRQLAHADASAELGDPATARANLAQRVPAAPRAATPTPPARRGEMKPPIAAADAPADDVPAVQLEFDDLAELDDRALAAVLSAAQGELTLLALTGAPQWLIDRVLKQLPRGEAKALRKRIGQTGPLRLRDIERAQQQLARVATRLAVNGEIRLPRVRRFAAAA